MYDSRFLRKGKKQNRRERAREKKKRITARAERCERARKTARQRETCVDVYDICCINHRRQTSNYDMRAQYKRDSKTFFFIFFLTILSAVPTAEDDAQVHTENVCTA